MTDTSTRLDIRRAASRFHTRTAWLDSWHSFSFGHHFDDRNTHHGLLLVSNEDRVRPNTGFGTHRHRDMEIVTWVLSGELEHRDSAGNHGLLRPGIVQRMSAGTGIEHSEQNPSATAEVHFIQMWVPPDTDGLDPSYEQRDVSDALDDGGLQIVASGLGDDCAIRIHQRDASLSAGRLGAHDCVTLPTAAHAHLFVARGTARLSTGDDLYAGDAVRMTGGGGMDLTALSSETEILLWATA